MSTIQYMLLSLVLLTVAVEAKKILRAQEGAAKTGKFMVALDIDTPDERFDELVEMVGIQANDQKIHRINGRFAKIITAKLSEESVEMIKNEANVKYIEEETVVTISQSVPWHLDRIDQRDLPLDGSFSLDHTGDGVDIYILDTGILYTHDEFGARALYPVYDPVDAATGSKQHGWDCDGHGTHVAALAGGKTYGAAKDAILYSVRVLDCDGIGTVAGVVDGINFAASEIVKNNHPGIISMSIGGGYAQAEIDAVEAAVASGAHVIVAAGNSFIDACKTAPAGAPSAITVGATDKHDIRVWYSNIGTCLDIFAPGVDITSASHSCDSCTTVLSGTSMACPIVSGVAATLLEANNMAPAELVQKLIDISTPGVVKDPQPGSPNRLLFGRDEVPPPTGPPAPPFPGYNWPSGPYILPKPTSGCPNRANLDGEGYVFQDDENDRNNNSASNPLSLSGSFDEDTRIDYCAYTTGGSDWPSGSYCLAQYSFSCPSGFSEGDIGWDDEDTANTNDNGGFIPSGLFGGGTIIFYCCRDDGSISTPMTLPTNEPFYLYQYSSGGCQQVAGMNVRQDWRYFDDENSNNANSVNAPHPYAAGGSNHLIYFCYYY